MATTCKDNIIDCPSIQKARAIKEVGSSSNEVDECDTIDINSTKSVKVKLAKSEILI